MDNNLYNLEFLENSTFRLQKTPCVKIFILDSLFTEIFTYNKIGSCIEYHLRFFMNVNADLSV